MSEFQQSTGSDRRVHQRLEDGRASLVELGGDNCGIVLNISEGGMAILSAEDLNGGNGLRNLRFQAPEFEHWIETEAEIAWISDSMFLSFNADTSTTEAYFAPRSSHVSR